MVGMVTDAPDSYGSKMPLLVIEHTSLFIKSGVSGGVPVVSGGVLCKCGSGI